MAIGAAKKSEQAVPIALETTTGKLTSWASLRYQIEISQYEQSKTDLRIKISESFEDFSFE